MNHKITAFIQLTRPPNLLTAISDIWAGIALSGYFLIKDYAVRPIYLLSISTVLLYAGGVVMNDVCDANLDAIERPERPIPSGRISLRDAFTFGILLLIIGIGTAALNGIQNSLIALLIACASLLYDRWGKHYSFLGPINMGVCRGLNLLLGMSVLPIEYNPLSWIAIIPVIYIAGVTLVSRGEVHGGKRSSILIAASLYLIVILSILGIAWIKHELIITLIFLIIFGIFIFIPLFRAMKIPTARHVGIAVKAGVVGLILMNASWVATSSEWRWAIITALLLPISLWMAKKFAIT